MAGGAFAAPVLAACATAHQGPPERLAAPEPVPGSRLPPGLHLIGTGGERDGVLSVPATEGPSPLIVMLHGSGGTGRRASRLLDPEAGDAGCLVLAPDSRGATWDAVTGEFGPDVPFLSRALAVVRPAASSIPPSGAGRILGRRDLCPRARASQRRPIHPPARLLARLPDPGCSAGHAADLRLPWVADEILPIASCSRKLVPALRRQGYDVRYREFEGRHEVPRADRAREAWPGSSGVAPPSDPRLPSAVAFPAWPTADIPPARLRDASGDGPNADKRSVRIECMKRSGLESGTRRTSAAPQEHYGYGHDPLYRPHGPPVRGRGPDRRSRAASSATCW